MAFEIGKIFAAHIIRTDEKDQPARDYSIGFDSVEIVRMSSKTIPIALYCHARQKLMSLRAKCNIGLLSAVHPMS